MSTTLILDIPVLEKRAPIDVGHPSGGTVYTDTVVFSPPEAFVKDAPYQIAIIDLDEGGRLTARIDGDNVVIGDRVGFLEYRGGIPFFRKPL
jgi:uncharacterized OB-fold protein